MSESRLPASPRRRLTLSLGLSLVLHGIALNSLGPTSFSARVPASGVAQRGLTVRLATATSPLRVSETPHLFIPAPPQRDLPPPSQGQAPADPGTTLKASSDAAPTSAPSRAGPSGIISGPWYYSARYLHRRPTPLRPIRPTYPPFTSDIAGRVVLLLLINEQGVVDTHRILKAEPADVFDNAVVEAFLNERYAPGLITGHPVKSQLLVEVFFEPGSAPRTGVLTDPPQ